MRHKSFSNWGIQTGPFAACYADFVPKFFRFPYLYTGEPISYYPRTIKVHTPNPIPRLPSKRNVTDYFMKPLIAKPSLSRFIFFRRELRLMYRTKCSFIYDRNHYSLTVHWPKVAPYGRKKLLTAAAVICPFGHGLLWPKCSLTAKMPSFGRMLRLRPQFKFVNLPHYG